jgi:glycosyltransferase involved in cell wall biosynthesis
MNFLVLATRIPAPDKKGDQVVAFHRLTYLAKRGHTIRLICFGDESNPEDFQARQNLNLHGINVKFVGYSRVEALFNLFVAFIRPSLPFQCAIYKSKAFIAEVNEAVRSDPPDSVYCILVRVLENLGNIDVKLFIEMVDSMALNFSRRASISSYLKPWILKIEARRIRVYEKYWANCSEHSFVVSDVDKLEINSHRISVIPLGIDLHVIKSTHCIQPNSNIVFTGNMHYQPNIDAVLWFVRNCWDNIKKIYPDVILIIAGRNPAGEVALLAKADSSIKVIGYVNSMSDVFCSASVAIAPMQSGSGMQFKILEAMANGVPVVTTHLGLGDIRASVGRDLLVADTANDFVECVVKLLRASDFRNQVGINGFNYVREFHVWDALNAKFENIITFDSD